MRKFFAIVVIFSLMAVTSVAQAFANGHSPGNQHELVMQMIQAADISPVFDFVRPATASVIFGTPPCESNGVIPDVLARCNSPGTID